MITFQERLKKIINLKYNGKWTVLAKEAGISPGSFKRYLDGVCKPGFDQILRICEVTNINPNWLLMNDGPMFKTKTEEDLEFKKLLGKKLIAWIKYFIKNASLKELHWLEIQFEKAFPEFREWVEKHKHE